MGRYDDHDLEQLEIEITVKLADKPIGYKFKVDGQEHVLISKDPNTNDIACLPVVPINSSFLPDTDNIRRLRKYYEKLSLNELTDEDKRYFYIEMLKGIDELDIYGRYTD